MASHHLVSPPTTAFLSFVPQSAALLRHGINRARIAERFKAAPKSAHLVLCCIPSESSSTTAWIKARNVVNTVLVINALQSQPTQQVPELSGSPAVAVQSCQSQPKQLGRHLSVWNILQQIAVCVLAAIIGCSLLPIAAHAVARNSIGASSLGIKVAEFLRGSGLPDELVVFIVAMLPVVELRGAIPISYWLKLHPLKGYFLAVLGNMVPVPFIVLYLEKISKSVEEGNAWGQKFFSWLFKRTREKAGPIEEFQWLGLLLFVAVPAPGTGAWTGAIAAVILGMSFWDAMTANLIGVAVAGLLVNLVVTVGVKEACLVAGLLGFVSCFMWIALRAIKKRREA